MTTERVVVSAAGESVTLNFDLPVRQNLITLPDFGVAGQPGVALWKKTGKILGTPGDTYQQVPLSPKNDDTLGANPATTPYYLIMVGGGSSSAISTDTEVSDITLLGNGVHPGLTRYHGLRVAYSTGAKILRTTVKGTVGTASSPPGETFHLPTWHANQLVLTDVTLDGRDASGAKVGATLWGATACDTSTVTRLKANYSQYGFGISLFNCSGDHVITDSDLRFNRKAINIEKSFGGTVRFVRCDFRGTFAADYIAQVSAASATVSTVVRFEDCIFDNDQCVVNCFASPGPNGTNGQKDSDISRWDTVGGVLTKQTALAKFKIVHE